MRSLENSNVMRIGVALIALATAVPALAAPPVMNDDSRVGAPPVIAPPAAPRPVVVTPRAAPPVVQAPPVQVRPQPVPVRAVEMPPKAMPPMPARVVPPVAPVAAPPKPVFAAEPPRARPIPPRGMPSPQPEREARRGADRGPGSAGAGYHRPEYGYQIPGEWTAPEYYISDFDSYGLSRPASGFGWSRYYDDAVLTDQWGRVYDWRDDVNWADHDEGYTGGNFRDERSYRDDRRDYDRSRDRKSRGKKYDYKGRWTGNWNGGPEQIYRGEWHGSVRPHWSGDGYRDNGGVSYGGGRYGSSYGYDGGGTTVTTVVVQTAAPVMTTHEISYDVVSYVPVRKKVVRAWKPRPKPVCACGS